MRDKYLTDYVVGTERGELSAGQRAWGAYAALHTYAAWGAKHSIVTKENEHTHREQ